MRLRCGDVTEPTVARDRGFESGSLQRRVWSAITIAGIELRRIRKGQFRLGRLGVQGRASLATWNAVLRA